MPTTPVAVGLGRDCSISINGAPLTGVRSVTVSASRFEIEVPLYSQAETYCFPGHRSLTIEIETIVAADAQAIQAAMNDATQGVTVSATNASGTFIVTSLSTSEPLDDVVVYTATLKRSFSNA